MKWNSSLQWEWHRRAVVSGTATLEPGRPPLAPADLWLQGAADGRRYRSHVRDRGVFFFLDVAPGRYALNGVDDKGAIVQRQKVVVPAVERGAKLPLLHLDVEIASLTSPDRRPRRARTRVTTGN